MNNTLNDIINKYLINYKVSISTIDKKNNLTFSIADENGTHKSMVNLKKEIHLVFGPINDYFLEKWFNDRTITFKKKVDYILSTLDDKYKLELGKYNWILINYNGKNIDFKVLTEELNKDTLPNKIFKKIYNNWYDIKVIKKTEELCGF